MTLPPDNATPTEDFMRIFLHELRNLVGPIHNAAYLIKLHRPNDPAIDGALQTIHRQIDKMIQLIEEVSKNGHTNPEGAILQSRPIAKQAHEHQEGLNHGGKPTRSADFRPKVLIVDDNPMFCATFAEILRELHYQVQEAHDGDEACSCAEKWRPNYVFIDINIPPPNGFEVARRLRSGFGSEMKLIMLSGITFTDATIHSAHEAGFDHCLDKTSDPEILVGWLGQAAAVRAN